MPAPTIAELLSEALVRDALDDAWAASDSGVATLRHEEGGWFFMDTANRTISYRWAPVGEQAKIDLNSPPVVHGSVVVATFHTHPNPTVGGWDPGPSPEDTRSAGLLGVPCLIRSDDGIYFTGPNTRRGGLQGSPGFPD